MTTFNPGLFDDAADAPRSPVARLFAQWPVFTCLFLSALFMLATNNPAATSHWQEVSREEITKLSMNLDTGRSTRQASFVLLGLWGVASFAWPARRYRPSVPALFGILVFVAWAWASVLWSTDRSFTLKRLVVFGCLGVAVLAFVRRHRVRDLALLALVGCTIQMIGSTVADLLWATGSYGKSGYRFSGLQHPNHSGINAAFLIFACLYFYDRTRLRRFLALMAVAAVVLYLTKSRSAIIAGLCGVTAFCALRWQARRLATAIVALAVLGCAFATLDAAGLVSDDWSSLIHMGRGDAEKTALTGRPQIWQAAGELIGNDPVRRLVGFGYQTFWTPDRAAYVTNRLLFHISEGHNAFFDLTLELGIVGAGAYALVLFGSLVRWSVAALQRDSASAALCAAIMTFVVVHSLTESTTIDPNFVTFFSYATMAFLALRAPAWRPRHVDDDERDRERERGCKPEAA